MDCDAKRIPTRSVRATVIPSALSAVDQATVCSKRRHKLSAIRIGNANRKALSCCKIAESPMCWITHANSDAPTNAASKTAFLIGSASLRDCDHRLHGRVDLARIQNSRSSIPPGKRYESHSRNVFKLRTSSVLLFYWW